VDDLEPMLGKTLLTGITYVDVDGGIVEQVQLVGRVVAIEPLVAIEVAGRDEPFTLPPLAEAFDVAPAGEYRLFGSGDLVVDPDYLTTWTVNASEDQ
jgi:hypothetical protein